jgi:hypothetical protein
MLTSGTHVYLVSPVLPLSCHIDTVEVRSSSLLVPTISSLPAVPRILLAGNDLQRHGGRMFAPQRLGRLPARHGELKHLALLPGRTPLHNCSKSHWDIKLNRLRHRLALQAVIPTTVGEPNQSYSWPRHSQPHLQHVESLNFSFLKSALHTAHDRIHMQLLHDLLTPVRLAYMSWSRWLFPEMQDSVLIDWQLTWGESRRMCR